MCGEVGRFAVVGAANTVVHAVAYLALWPVLPYLVAHLCAICVAMICSYLLNCRFTFGVRPGLRTFLLFPLSNLTNIGLSTVIAYVSVDLCGLDSRLAPIAGGLLAVPATFLVSRFVLTTPSVLGIPERGKDGCRREYWRPEPR